MKLVIAIIHHEDEHRLTKALSKSDFGVTKLASTGGFLKTGNTTLLIGVDEERVSDVIKILKSNCDSRTELTSTSAIVGDGRFIGTPIEVPVGGATIFVVNVDEYFKI